MDREGNEVNMSAPAGGGSGFTFDADKIDGVINDPGAAALRALVERLQPQQLTVALQLGRTVVDGPALARLLEDTGGELISDPEPRYRHGKLIEWRIDETL
jgi:hypothetical protein